MCIPTRIQGGVDLSSKVIPVRLDDEVLKFIEELVRLGIYSSRSEALRDVIKIGIEKMGVG